jgi:hypothetical protein
MCPVIMSSLVLGVCHVIIHELCPWPLTGAVCKTQGLCLQTPGAHTPSSHLGRCPIDSMHTHVYRQTDTQGGGEGEKEGEGVG